MRFCWIARLEAALVRAASERRGAVAVEFALVAPALIFVFVAIFQIGYNYFTMAGLDAASRAGARALMTGSVQQAGMQSAQFITNVICPSLPSTMQCSQVQVNVQVVLQNPTPQGLTASTMTLPTEPVQPTSYYPDFVTSTDSGLMIPPPSYSFCPGYAGDIVVVQVLYPAPMFTKILNPANSSSLLQMSTSTFMNEPFGGAQIYTGCL